ncbi:MAG: DUF4440 domain-containing protein [Terriglobia bacterium]
MADEELVSLAGEWESLTEAAKNALWAELSRRGLQKDARRAAKEPAGKEAEVEIPEKLLTIATFSQPIEAHSAKAQLENKGIECVLAHEHSVGLFGLASALGGIKLQVREADVERATEILEQKSGEAELAALREADSQYIRTFVAKDADLIMGYYAEDAMLLPPNAPRVEGSEAIRDFVNEFISTPGLSMSFETLLVEVSFGGDMGYTLTTFEITMDGPDGNPVTDQVKSVHVWKKQAGDTWKIVVDIWNSDQPPPGAATE